MDCGNVQLEEARILMKAYCQAGKALGLSHQAQAKILGIHCSTFSRNAQKGFASKPKVCELQLHFVSLYQSLYAIAGGDKGVMQHWFHTYNRTLKGIPAQQCNSVQGLLRSAQYLGALQHH